MDRKHYEDLVLRYFRMVDEENIEAIVDCFCDDGEISFPLLASPAKGKSGLRKFFQEHVERFSEHHDKVTSFIFEENQGASEIEFIAKTTGGKLLHFRACNIYEFRDGKFKSVKIYLDTVPLREAFG